LSKLENLRPRRSADLQAIHLWKDTEFLRWLVEKEFATGNRSVEFWGDVLAAVQGAKN
jgi:hypothetical protein